MKRTLATLTAAATLAATSAFAVTTLEDKALNEALRTGQIAPIAQAEYTKPQNSLTGRSGLADSNGYIYVTKVEGAGIDENAPGRR